MSYKLITNQDGEAFGNTPSKLQAIGRLLDSFGYKYFLWVFDIC